jgi:hypothetical protein
MNECHLIDLEKAPRTTTVPERTAQALDNPQSKQMENRNKHTNTSSTKLW